jgi:hypothetical protein
MFVITKAGEIRLDESLATFVLRKGATFYLYAELVSVSVKSEYKEQIT